MAEKKPQPGRIKVAINHAYRYGEANVATVALVALGIGIRAGLACLARGTGR